MGYPFGRHAKLGCPHLNPTPVGRGQSYRAVATNQSNSASAFASGFWRLDREHHRIRLFIAYRIPFIP